MATLEEFAPHLEVYSIDEAFLDISGICQLDSIAYGQGIKRAVFRSTGIPVCVGMGPTKTLAKLANYAAKKWKKTQGVLDLSDPLRREKLMKLVPVREVWGVGSATAAKLNQLGIHTVWDLASQTSECIHSQFNIVLARTVMELNGIPCLQLEEIALDKQQIVCSRTFSQRLTEFSQISQAMADYASRAAEKLRMQHSVTGCVSVFIRTNPFVANQPQYQRIAGSKLQLATQDTRTIVATANRLLQEIFKSGYAYQKCGVQLSDIRPESRPGQLELFDLRNPGSPAESRPLMTTIDHINRRYPKAISLAVIGHHKTWNPKMERISQHYTTDWRELVSVKCG